MSDSFHTSLDRAVEASVTFGDPRLLERFWSKVAPDEATGCWNWTGAKNDAGYGQLRLGGKAQYAHRIMWTVVRGPIPKGWHIDHLCRNPACCQVRHLEPVTHRENIRRGFAIRTHCPAGHEYSDENTYHSPVGHRRCRECARQRDHNRPRRGKKQ